MTKMFVVFDENGSHVGVTPDFITAKRLAREEIACRQEDWERPVNVLFEQDYDEIEAKRFWVSDAQSALIPILIIEEIEFFDEGTRFPVEMIDITEVPDLLANVIPAGLGDDVTFEIPNFLKRQAK